MADTIWNLRFDFELHKTKNHPLQQNTQGLLLTLDLLKKEIRNPVGVVIYFLNVQYNFLVVEYIDKLYLSRQNEHT